MKILTGIKPAAPGSLQVEPSLVSGPVETNPAEWGKTAKPRSRHPSAGGIRSHTCTQPFSACLGNRERLAGHVPPFNRECEVNVLHVLEESSRSRTGEAPQPIGLGFQGVVLDDGDSAAEGIRDPSGALLDDVSEFMPE